MYITSTQKKYKDKYHKQNSSIVHWSHINFYGEYDFTRSFKKVAKLIAIEDKKLFQNTKTWINLFKGLIGEV